MLELSNLHGWYGESHILHGVDLQVRQGEVVTLLGRNGAGKSTTLKAIMGLVSQKEGSIRFRGREISTARPHEIARAGIAYCPEERGVFTTLTVTENLMLPPTVDEGGVDLATIYKMFPNLKERAGSPGSKLSGGEQQMLAIGRILRTGAKLLLLDEPTEGLAPVIVKQIGRTLADIKALGFTILLVEQNLRFATKVADCHYVMEHGRIIDRVEGTDMSRKAEKLQNYLKL